MLGFSFCYTHYMKNKKVVVSLGFAAFMLVAAGLLQDTTYTKYVLIGLVALWFVVLAVLKELPKQDKGSQTRGELSGDSQ